MILKKEIAEKALENEVSRGTIEKLLNQKELLTKESIS
ncbi:Uncharacterised protein [Sphingobacterium multivorum]|uniref:Uncharacterized protein n=1 Tax=Sphingobacterium multivorum TaxID=28454 RepID=A0A2X2LEF9_SPHMU|nr:Uncharacterised protein [Sphingobacterium multivorum]